MLFLQKLDPGAAVALGAPLHVRMFVPLWVVNATSLPVAALVVPVQPPQQSSEHEGQAGDNLLDAAESIRLKVLETDAGDGAPAAGSRSRRWHSSHCLIGACAQNHPEYDEEARPGVCMQMHRNSAEGREIYDESKRGFI